LIADRSYDSMPLRRALRERNIEPIIPHRRYVNPRAKHRGRPPGTYAKEQYQGRWKIERSNAWMDNYRRVAVSWDRTQTAFTAWVTLSCILICMNNIPRWDHAHPGRQALSIEDLAVRDGRRANSHSPAPPPRGPSHRKCTVTRDQLPPDQMQWWWG
jgi:transposase